MTLLYYSRHFLDHETGRHPERADRIRGLPERLEAAGLAGRCGRPDFQPAQLNWISRIHSPAYMNEIWAFSKSGGGYIEADTVVSPASYDVALLAAGAVCDATARVIRGEDSSAVCLVRPPGHHALVNRAMGFCIFNNVAIAARLAIDELGLQRVLVVDWDIHHCNGTQAAFWDEPRVGILSIHRWPFYPGTGAADETGGQGTIRNLPVAFDISRKEYLSLFTAALGEMADRMKPELVLVSAGFDTHRLDPIGGLGLESEDFAALTRAVMEAAQAHAQGRVISALEGGYDPAALAESVEAHLGEMLHWQSGTRDEG